jgi:ribosomal protein S18 acetylase RimI-like enzyme
MAGRAAEDGIAILVDGFFDNPVMAWIFQDEATRAEALDAWFRFWVGAYRDQGLLIETEGGDGAALWARPDVSPLRDDEAASLVEIVRERNGDRTGLVLGGLTAVHQPTERHWYLNAIAARRGQRARGVGARLLEPFLARSDSEGVPIYLESSNARNLSFYRRYGFEDHGPRVDLPENGPPLQGMWRSPGSSR